jgi:hydroxypyruvate reductase
VSASAALEQDARAIFAGALNACRLDEALSARLKPGPDDHPYRFTLEPGMEFDLEGVERLVVVALGKAAAPLLEGFLRRIRIPERCRLEGILIGQEWPQRLERLERLRGEVRYFRGGHPSPTSTSFAAAEAVLALLGDAAANADRRPALCVFLVTGGGSAMMELPLDRSISLEETIRFHQALVHCGATIAEMNCVRKHFSAVKGGRLGALVARVPRVTLLVSDVPGGQSDALASGPTVPDSSTCADCMAVLRNYDLLARFPDRVRDFFLSPNLPETPKPGSFAARCVTLLSDQELAQAAFEQARRLGFTAVIDHTCDDWDYREAAAYLLGRLRALRLGERRVCVISSGEVSVRVPAELAELGVGGRNQHFALYTATLLEPADGDLAVLSAGSDGIDGNSPFAGAVLSYERLHQGETAASAREALRRFDSATFLDRLGATLLTGPTGNNLRDLRVLLAG